MSIHMTKVSLRWMKLTTVVPEFPDTRCISFLKDDVAIFNVTWHKASLGEGEQICSNEGPHLFTWGIITKWRTFKIVFSRTITQNLTKHGIKYPLGKRDLSLFKGHVLFQAELNCKNTLTEFLNFKILFSRPNGRYSTNQIWHKPSLTEVFTNKKFLKKGYFFSLYQRYDMIIDFQKYVRWL